MATDTTTATSSPTSSTSTGSAPALIVTSGDSRTNYSNNVNTLNTAKSNLPTNNPSIVDFMNTNGMPSDYNSRAALAKSNGIVGYTGSASQNTQLLGILQNGQTKTDTTTPTDTSKTDALNSQITELKGKVTDAQSAGYGNNDEIQYDTNGKVIPKTSTTNSDGSVDTGDGMTTMPDGTRIASSLKGVYDTSMANLDQGIATAKQNLSMALSTLQNDPVATNAINLIMQKYDVQIEAMKNKNRMLLGSNVVNQARGGGMQYANEMSSNFMSDEQDKASQRVTDLITLESNAIMSAEAAYKKGDVAAFDAASKALDSAQKEKTTAINNLLNATDKIVKEQQAQAKIDAANIKQQTTDNLRISAGLGKTVADQIKTSGIKDPKQIDAYISEMAKNSGISDPNLLRSAVVKAQQEQQKLDLSSANIQSTIANRGKKTGTASASFKVSPAIAKVTPQFEAIKGNDGYIDPAKWVTARTTWNSLGGTDATFTSNFKKYLNPDSYAVAGLKTAKTSSTIPQ